MARASLRFHNVSFAYQIMTGDLFTNLTLHFRPGWTGVVGANGAGKTTILRLAAGQVSPTRGSVEARGRMVLCAQGTGRPPAGLDRLLAAECGRARRLRDVLGLAPDLARRWGVLSHGERRRAQIGLALWLEPDILALDEPDNHLDAAAADLLARVLAGFKGIGLLISHNRELLDRLCWQCLFVEPPRAVLRPGGYSRARLQADLEVKSLSGARERAERDIQRLNQEAQRRRADLARTERRRSKRGLAPKDSDAREKINRARLSGRDAAAGRRLGRMAGRLNRARAELEDSPPVKAYRTGIELPGRRSRRDLLFFLEAGSVDLGPGRRLVYPRLLARPADRIGLTGPNGSGKSSLLELIVSRLRAVREAAFYLPQELDAGASGRIWEQVRGLPQAELGQVMTIVSRLGSRPGRLLESLRPSPGETRKLCLALAVARRPEMIILDEPTNHLDLPAIECLEDALAGFPGGLLIASHDRRFLDRLTDVRRRILNGSSGEYRLEAG